MGSNSARCSHVSTTMDFSACFSPWTLGFQFCGLQDWRQELGSLYVGKAAFLHLRPPGSLTYKHTHSLGACSTVRGGSPTGTKLV